MIEKNNINFDQSCYVLDGGGSLFHDKKNLVCSKSLFRE